MNKSGKHAVLARRALCAAGFFVLGVASGAAPAQAVEVRLSSAKVAAYPVVTSAGASAGTRASAAVLSKFLGRMAQCTFATETGDGLTGIAVGTVKDFPAVNMAGLLNGTDIMRREEYVLRSHAKGLYVIGATDLAVSHAVWDTLHRLGYRRFFPGPNWEVVPQLPSLRLDVDTHQKPAYLARRIWYGFGSWKPNMADKAAWDEANRMAAGVNVQSGHAYETIVKTYKAEFEAHPEYFANPKSNKFCVSNPGLRKLVVKYALDYFEKNPDRDSISLEPSDGGGWETTGGACGDDKAYKSVSDRVVSLANEVAAAVNARFPGKIVGIYAYYQHSAPPTIKVHPNVSVNVATAYIQGGFTFRQLMEGWRQQGARLLGVREYFSVFDGHRDRPAGPNSSDLGRIPTRTVGAYQMGGRLMSAEATESWGGSGLPYYMTSRLLWDPTEKPDDIVEDFLTKAFGDAHEPMREFYRVIDRSTKPLFTRHLLGQMYRCLQQANGLNKDPAVKARLDDLVLWTRYCEMLWEWENQSKDRKADGEAILKFTYRWGRNGMMHSYVLWRHAYNFDRTYPEETKFNVPEGKNPWKSAQPIPVAEIDGFLARGVERNPLAPFKAKTFSSNLVPATSLGLESGPTGEFGYTRMEQNYLFWIENPAMPLKLRVRGGQIAQRGNSTLTLYSGAQVQNAGGEENEEEDDNNPAIAGVEGGAPNAAMAGAAGGAAGAAQGAVVSVDVPNNREYHEVELRVPARGLYRLQVVDRGKGAEVNWPDGTPVVMESSARVQTLLRGIKLVRYFYVPKGTKEIGGYTVRAPQLLAPDGKVAQVLPKEPAYFSVAVPPGQDGKIWGLRSVGQVLLMTVPPYLARNAAELMVPAEVLATDKK